jgi:hypothetical protein
MGSSMPPTTTTEPERPRPARPERAAGMVVGGVAESVASRSRRFVVIVGRRSEC